MPLPAAQNETSAGLPSAWIDRLFERFAVMYGRHWFDLWAGVEIDSVKAAWREDLAFASGEQIRKALDHCRGNNKFPPTLPEFVGLFRAFAPAMDTSRALPDYLRAEMDPLVRAEIARFLNPERKRDPKDWAREILRLHAEGRYPHHIGLVNARRALGIEGRA